ncbi:MAG: MraY family glycosyltransferase [Thermodesulfobacteriota bacterium]
MRNLYLFFISLLISFLFTPLTIRLANIWQVVDNPGQVKIQKEPTPRLGGLAIFSGVFLSLLFYLILKEGEIGLQVLGVMLGAMAIFLVGLLDDIFELKPLLKFSGQLLAALIPILFGLRMEIAVSLWISVPLTLFFVLGACNALNLIDGLDGLASGVTILVSTSFLTLFLIQGNPFGALLSLMVMGSNMGFLRYNFHKAKTYMGDSGSLFLGYILAILAILCINSSQNRLSSLLAAVLILGLPVYDTALSILRRYLNKKSISVPDLGHFYNRLMTGYHLSHRKAVGVCWIISSVFGLLGIFSYISTLRIGLFILLSVGIICTIGTFRLGFLEE